MICVRTTFASTLACLVVAGQAPAAEYMPCADSHTSPHLKGSVCTNETVPLSYADVSAAEGGSVNLFVRQFPAAGRSKGTIWLVAGGPGESGATLYPMIDVLRHSFPGFDLHIPDHRGTGYSSRLCPQEEAADSPGGMALAGAEWGSCFKRLTGQPGIAKDYSITNAAHDLKHLIERSATGKPVYVYGVSYGTQLVLRTLQLGKMPVRGVILDSLVPLQDAAQWDLSRRSHVVDDIGRKVLAECDRDRACHRMMGGDAEHAYRRLLALSQQQPALLASIPGKNLKRFFGNLLNVPAVRVRIPQLVMDLEAGRSVTLAEVVEEMAKAGASLGGFVQSPVSIPVVSIISASENNLRPELGIDDLRKEDERLLFASELPELLVKPALPVYPRDQYFGQLPAHLPPVLVLSGTLDPKTHYDGALSHIRALKKAGPIGLVSVIGAPHFILWTAPECFARHARNFVQRGVLKNQRCELRSSAGNPTSR